MNITIYHNPSCGTSRNVLAALREAGYEPRIVEYLKTPLSREAIAGLLARMKVPARSIVREKEKLFGELGLQQAGERGLIDAMARHPILMNRPIVEIEGGAVRLCRPSETAKELL
jgi:arsenate reductase (glutaredoxin)